MKVTSSSDLNFKIIFNRPTDKNTIFQIKNPKWNVDIDYTSCNTLYPKYM